MVPGQFAEAVAKDVPMGLQVHTPLWSREDAKRIVAEEAARILEQFESRGTSLELYLWLSQLFPSIFVER